MSNISNTDSKSGIKSNKLPFYEN